MKKWKCEVCGYIHEGDEPPAKCPVCGADRSRFVLIADESEASEETVASATPTEAPVEKRVEPPKVESRPIETSTPKKGSGLYDTVTQLMSKHHIHPISVHIPNGVLPLTVILTFLAALFHAKSLELAAFYNLIFVVLAMPLVMFTGYNDWQKRYAGSRTDMFITKIGCAILVSILAVVLLIWWIIDPDAATNPSSRRWIFVFVHIVMLGAAGIAGHLGGKLVFKD